MSLSPLQRMTHTGPTCLWSDSIAASELAYSVEHGATGATCNPAIVLDVLKKEWPVWSDRIAALAEALPRATEDEIAWKIVEEMSVARAEMLMPAFETHRGRNGRLSVQTDPRLFRDREAMLQQARRFHGLAPNIIVKLPATDQGIAVMEEATSEGISINATISFTAAQCIAVAEAVERGLKRRAKAGHDITQMGPVSTIMAGRLDDWLKLVAEKRGIVINPGHLEWAGIAVFKKVYAEYRKRGYRTRLLSSAFRNHMHWSELIGGDVVISPPYKWQLLFNGSDVEVISRIHEPVSPEILRELGRNFDDFGRAYDFDAMPVADFVNFGPTRRTLRQFLEAGQQLSEHVRKVLVPDPDIELN